MLPQRYPSDSRAFDGFVRKKTGCRGYMIGKKLCLLPFVHCIRITTVRWMVYMDLVVVDRYR